VYRGGCESRGSWQVGRSSSDQGREKPTETVGSRHICSLVEESRRESLERRATEAKSRSGSELEPRSRGSVGFVRLAKLLRYSSRAAKQVYALLAGLLLLPHSLSSHFERKEARRPTSPSPARSSPFRHHLLDYSFDSQRSKERHIKLQLLLSCTPWISSTPPL